MSIVAPIIRVSTDRRLSNTDPTRALTTARHLSSFQVEKYTFMFNQLFDLHKNFLIEESDIYALAEKMRKYAGWSEDSDSYKRTLDVQFIFLECLQDQVKMEQAASTHDDVIASWDTALTYKAPKVTSVSLQQWLNMWGRLTYCAAGLGDFPIWVQMLPNIFFDVIDLDKDEELTFEEYKKFYRDFVGVPVDELDKVANEGYRAMTAGGDYKLTRDNFCFCFANFLLGRSIYGPGKYIFGIFDNRDIDETFQVVYNEEDEEE